MLMLNLEDTVIGVFWLHVIVVRRPNLKVATKRLLLQNVSEVLGCYLLRQMSSQ